MKYIAHYLLLVFVGLSLMTNYAMAENPEVTSEPVYKTTSTEDKVDKIKVVNTYSSVSLSQLIELLISLDIIPAEKAEQARAVVKSSEYTSQTGPCPSAPFRYNHYLGVSDKSTEGEVTRLQSWLAAMPDIYPEKLITGYFGPATELAVQRYQVKLKIVSSGAPDTTGFGVVGPLTRGKINACIPGYQKSDDVLKTDYKNVDVDESKDVEQDEVKKEVPSDDTDKDKDAQDTSAPVTSITLHPDQLNKKVWWKTVGYAKDGYWLMWSKQSNPTYPVRTGDMYKYLYEPNSDHSRLEAFDGSGTYYIRICENSNNVCGLYSNEVIVVL